MAPALYPEDASIVLIGMRGVGKTTLGLIAATSLRRPFRDADATFQSLHGGISAYVNEHGWPAFRDAETIILRNLLSEHPKGYVIACGGGVVEREENREMLRQFSEIGPVVHVVRDKEETVRYLVDETRRPAWGEEIRHVWARRTPYFESLATHTIVSLTAHPRPVSPQFLMKHVETAFVRLLRGIFGMSALHVPLVPGPAALKAITGPSSGEYGGYGACETEMGRGAKGSRTSFVALNFPDLRIVSGETIRKVAEGVDVLELRVDTLVPSRPDTPPDSRRGSPNGYQSSYPHHSSSSPSYSRPPSPYFVALCFGHLRRCSPLPVLYTVRTKSQGGNFPDPYDDPELLEEYIALVELGFKLGAEYVDLELSLPDETFSRLLAMRGAATQCLAADHDRAGAWSWDSQPVMDKYLRAVQLGADVVKLVSFPNSFVGNLELLKFRQRVDSLDLGRKVPLLAINLGKAGQMSRYLNPVFTPVTHPLLPGVAAPGQLTFAQTMHALYLSGLILEKTFFVPTISVAESFTLECQHLGLPYTFIVEDRLQMRTIERDFGGAFLGAKAIPTSAIEEGRGPMDDVLPPARNTGWTDVVVPASTEPESYDVPPTALVGSYKHTNVRVLALAEVISQNLSPINAVGTATNALLVGLDKKDLSEVLEALSIVGARWVSLYQCEGHQPSSTTPLSPSSSVPLPLTSLNGGGVLSSFSSSNPPSSTSTNATPATTTQPQPPPRFASRPPSRSGTPTIPYPQHPTLVTQVLSSYTDPLLYTRRPPTIIISSDSAPSPFPERILASPTGGAAIDLSSPSPSSTASSSNSVGGGGGGGVMMGKGVLRDVIGGRGPGGGNREGWMLLGQRELQVEVERQAFRALTGRRMS
ncbi:aldolase [Meredithblackwellia eburnea MCA 4105]